MRARYETLCMPAPTDRRSAARRHVCIFNGTARKTPSRNQAFRAFRTVAACGLCMPCCGGWYNFDTGARVRKRGEPTTTRWTNIGQVRRGVRMLGADRGACSCERLLSVRNCGVLENSTSPRIDASDLANAPRPGALHCESLPRTCGVLPTRAIRPRFSRASRAAGPRGLPLRRFAPNGVVIA